MVVALVGFSIQRSFLSTKFHNSQGYLFKYLIDLFRTFNNLPKIYCLARNLFYTELIFLYQNFLLLEILFRLLLTIITKKNKVMIIVKNGNTVYIVYIVSLRKWNTT